MRFAGRYQDGRRSRSWRLSIEEQRREIEALISDNPSLAPAMQEIFDRAYRVGRLRALRETRLGDEAIAETNPFSLAEALENPLDE